MLLVPDSSFTLFSTLPVTTKPRAGNVGADLWSGLVWRLLVRDAWIGSLSEPLFPSASLTPAAVTKLSQEARGLVSFYMQRLFLEEHADLELGFWPYTISCADGNLEQSLRIQFCS